MPFPRINHSRNVVRLSDLDVGFVIWIYADRDPLYNEAGRQAILKAWRDSGGMAEYLLVTEHALPNPHAIPSDASYWELQLDNFLKSLNH